MLNIKHLYRLSSMKRKLSVDIRIEDDVIAFLKTLHLQALSANLLSQSEIDILCLILFKLLSIHSQRLSQAILSPHWNILVEKSGLNASELDVFVKAFH
jgi:hypothetical protein